MIAASWSPSLDPSPATSRKILVADDDLSSRTLLVDLLEGEGYQVFPASDGHEALKILMQGSIDLALLDVMMPGETGFSICRQIKGSRETRLIPVVLVTGLASVSDRGVGIEVVADRCLSIP